MKDPRFRLVGIYGNWSSDEWDEINFGDPALRRPDHGPGRFKHMLCGIYDQRPSPALALKALAGADDDLSARDGCYRLAGHSVLTSIQWQQLVGTDQARFVGRSWRVNQAGAIEVPEIWEYRSFDMACTALTDVGAEITTTPASASPG